MHINDNLGVKGQVDIVLLDANGNVKTRRQINNLVVQAGKDLISQAFLGTSSDTVTHVGLGTGTTAAASTQTALVTAIAPRLAVDSTTPTINPATVTYVATFGAGVATATVSEAGLFTALTSGTMVARTSFSGIPKQANDVIVVTWTLIFG